MVNSVSMAVLVLCVGAGNPAVPSRVDQQLPASSGGRVVVDNPLGTLEVRGAQQDVVHVTGSIGAGSERFIFEKQGDVTVVRVVIPQEHKLFQRVEGSHLVVTVPQGSELEVAVVSADAKVDRMTGATQVHSVSGDVRVTGMAGTLCVNAVSGDVQVEGTPPRVEVDAVSGDVVMALGRDAVAVRVQTVGGDVTVKAPRVDRLDVNTVSGNAELMLDPGSSAESRVSSQSGDVVWRVSSLAAASFVASSLSGDVHLPGKMERVSRGFGPGNQGRSVVGNGFGGVKISTVSGDVDVRQQ